MSTNSIKKPFLYYFRKSEVLWERCVSADAELSSRGMQAIFILISRSPCRLWGSDQTRPPCLTHAFLSPAQLHTFQPQSTQPKSQHPKPKIQERHVPKRAVDVSVRFQPTESPSQPGCHLVPRRHAAGGVRAEEWPSGRTDVVPRNNGMAWMQFPWYGAGLALAAFRGFRNFAGAASKVPSDAP
jgi:hypothetical protein